MIGPLQPGDLGLYQADDGRQLTLAQVVLGPVPDHPVGDIPREGHAVPHVTELSVLTLVLNDPTEGLQV